MMAGIHRKKEAELVGSWSPEPMVRPSADKVRSRRPCLFFSFKHKSLHHSQFIFIFWFSNTNQAQICFLLVVRSRLFELVIALFWLILSTLSNILDLPTCSLAICVARTEIQHLPCFLQMFSEKYLFRLWWVVCWLLQFHSGTGSAEEHLAFKLMERSMVCVCVCVSQLNSWSIFEWLACIYILQLVRWKCIHTPLVLCTAMNLLDCRAVLLLLLQPGRPIDVVISARKLCCCVWSTFQETIYMLPEAPLLQLPLPWCGTASFRWWIIYTTIRRWHNPLFGT